MFMSGEKVATEPWVYNLLADVWQSLNDLSDAAGSNADSVKGLGGALANQAITDVSYDISASSHLYTVSLLNKKGATVTSFIALYAHAHDIEFKEGSGGTITVTMGQLHWCLLCFR